MSEELNLFVLKCVDPRQNLWEVYDGSEVVECHPFGSPIPKHGIASFRRVRESLTVCLSSGPTLTKKFLEVCHDSKESVVEIYARARDPQKLRKEGLIY
jgi:hypothetical protein